jgi:hypothetical protein
MLPFKGGWLVPAPDLSFPGWITNAAGSIAISVTWPPGVPSGFSMWMQFWMVDPAGPAGCAASGAIAATTP